MNTTFEKQPHHIQRAVIHLADSARAFRKKDGEGTVEAILKKFGDQNAEVLTKLGASDAEIKAARTRLDALEKKLDREPGGGNDHAVKSLGTQFVESENFKSWVEPGPRQGKADLMVKTTLTSATTDAAGSVGAGVSQNTREPGIGALPRRRRVVRDLCEVRQMDGIAAEWVQIKGRTNGAGMVAEAAAKPESDLQLEIVQSAARTIATWTKATTQILSDIPALRSLIDGELLENLELCEEDQLLNGDGTGQNLLGLVPQATAYSAPISVGDANLIDAVALAALQVALQNYSPTGAIVHPANLLEMRLLKNSQGDYVLGSPSTPIQDLTLFGLPVVSTVAMTQGRFLTGDFRTATIFDRWLARVETGFVNDDFTKNLVTVRAEERLALGVKRPASLVYGLLQ